MLQAAIRASMEDNESAKKSTEPMEDKDGGSDSKASVPHYGQTPTEPESGAKPSSGSETGALVAERRMAALLRRRASGAGIRSVVCSLRIGSP